MDVPAQDVITKDNVSVKVNAVLYFRVIDPNLSVVEDATDIILNLKQIPFKLAGDAPKAIYLRADQPGVVTSGMARISRMDLCRRGIRNTAHWVHSISRLVFCSGLPNPYPQPAP